MEALSSEFHPAGFPTLERSVQGTVKLFLPCMKRLFQRGRRSHPPTAQFCFSVIHMLKFMVAWTLKANFGSTTFNEQDPLRANITWEGCISVKLRWLHPHRHPPRSRTNPGRCLPPSPRYVIRSHTIHESCFMHAEVWWMEPFLDHLSVWHMLQGCPSNSSRQLRASLKVAILFAQAGLARVQDAAQCLEVHLRPVSHVLVGLL